MGKIFDALEKSKDKGRDRGLTVVFNDNPSAPEGPAASNIEEIRYNDFNLDLVTLLQPQSIEAEQFKMLKTNLLFPASGKPPRVIMVTSATPGEGKSFVSGNMAITMAQGIDDNVLLMDCDLRQPVIHKRFGLGEGPGLSEYLSKGTPLSNLLRKTQLSKLAILPAGTPPHNPAELLSSEQMMKLVEEVKTRYSDRYIIIDTAPPQLTAEGGALAQMADGIIIVVRYGKTPREIVKALIENLGRDKILGVIVNMFDVGLSSYYGPGKYEKYGKYYS